MRKRLAAATALLAVTIPAVQDAQAAGTPTAKITVSATEFAFRLSKSSAPAGTVAFTVVNKGKAVHDFRIAGKTTRKLAPGASATLSVNFAKAGSVRYVCTLPGHAAAGMRGLLRITAPAAKPVVVAIEVVDGRPVGGVARPTIKKGQTVRLVVSTNAGTQVHLHGYELEKDVVKGKATVIQFVAKLPGRFELELHPFDALLAQLTVSP